MAHWIVTGLSTIISIISIYLSLQTYYVSQRPYVGVFDIKINIEHNEKGVPVKMAWQFLVKNSGNIPAFMTTEKHVCQLKQGERNIPFPGFRSPGKTDLILPDQIVRLMSSFLSDLMGVTVQDVFNGKAILTCDTELSYTTTSYTTIGWFLSRKFFYYVNHQFTPEFKAFLTNSTSAN